MIIWKTLGKAFLIADGLFILGAIIIILCEYCPLVFLILVFIIIIFYFYNTLKQKDNTWRIDKKN